MEQKREKHKYKMKKLVSAFMLLGMSWFMTGCGEKEESILPETYVTYDDLLNKNNIEDVVEVFQRTNLWNDGFIDDSKIMYYGNRKGKDWFALFDKQSETLLGEWYGKERAYVRPEGSFYDGEGYFEQLKNGKYIGSYYFEPDSIGELVRLSDNQKVEYGFEWSSPDNYFSALTEDRILYDEIPGRGGVVRDFTGNIIATGVCGGSAYQDDFPGGISASRNIKGIFNMLLD